MSATPSFAPASNEPLAILTPAALFERQCVLAGIGADAKALRAMLHGFFEAGMAAGERRANAPVRHPANPDHRAHDSSDTAFAALGEIGFDPAKVKAALARTVAESTRSTADVDAFLRDAVRNLIVVRGRLCTEINYKGVVEAYDAAVRVHGA
jgi:hypothetical protein